MGATNMNLPRYCTWNRLPSQQHGENITYNNTRRKEREHCVG